jgi:DNA-directed RNA polymerase subunit F
MPDAELMRKASLGELSKPEIYRSEIVRLLDDPKSRNLTEDFAVQWFSLDEIDHVSDNVPYAVALKSQPLDFVKYLFAADRPLLELIDSDVAYFNTLTSRFYPQDRKQLAKYRKPKGIEVEIVPNQQIRLQDTSERGGLLTMPGVLAMNKGPVLRGVWMLERLLGEPLPDPPPDVGQIPKNRNGQTLTFRERFELHRSKPACAVCHDKIDPLGFSLERYDKSGAFVAKSGEAIDTSGQLPSGEKFSTYQELKEILVTSQRDQIVRNIVQKTMSYALCRKLEYYDRPSVDKIVNELNRSDGTYRDLIRLVAESLPFRETIIKGESE